MNVLIGVMYDTYQYALVYQAYAMKWLTFHRETSTHDCCYYCEISERKTRAICTPP